MSEGIRFGPYELIKRLARGGMGEVFLARRAQDPGAGFVALKRLSTLRGDDPAARHAFLDEARLASRVDHPFLVRTHELGEAEGTPYLVMEYVHGVSFTQLLERTRANGHLLPWEPVLRAMLCIAEALQQAHAQLGLVHRDVTPSNIMLAANGTPKLIDFGVAGAPGRPDRFGHVRASRAYAAPEQLRGGLGDVRTDVYGLGLTAYELLSGVQPFEDAEPAQTLERVAHERQRSLGALRSGLPAELAKAVDAALEKDPARRPATMLDFRERLEGVFLKSKRFAGIVEIRAMLEQVFPEMAPLASEDSSATPTILATASLRPGG